MGKKEALQKQLRPLLEDFYRTQDESPLVVFLEKHGNLPSPRANLELTEALTDLFTETIEQQTDPITNLLVRMTALDSKEAPEGTSREFIPFCGTWAFGATASLSLSYGPYKEDALDQLHKLSRDARWRVREAVAHAVGRFLEHETDLTLNTIEKWIRPGAWYPMRAVVAGMVEAVAGRKPDLAEKALQFHEKVISHIEASPEEETRKSEAFRALRKGLGFTISVVTCEAPKQGFELLARLKAAGDPDLAWISERNLKKNRLRKQFPELVHELD